VNGAGKKRGVGPDRRDRWRGVRLFRLAAPSSAVPFDEFAKGGTGDQDLRSLPGRLLKGGQLAPVDQHRYMLRFASQDRRRLAAKHHRRKVLEDRIE